MNSVPQTAATTFAISSVFILLLWLYTVQYTLVCLFVYIYLANKPDLQLFIHSQLRQARFLEIQIIFETGRYWKAMGIRVKCVSFFTCVFF